MLYSTNLSKRAIKYHPYILSHAFDIWCSVHIRHTIDCLVLLAQCLYSVSEDNSHVSRPVAESVETLRALKEALQFPGSSANHMLLHVLTAGTTSTCRALV